MTSLTVACLSLTISPDEKLESFVNRITGSLQTIPTETDIVVFPEYCWGQTPFTEVISCIEKIKTDFQFNIIFGTHPFQLTNKVTTNNAMISIIDQEIQYSPKTIPMEGERERNNIEPGANIGVIEVNKIKLGVIICADLWNWKLVYDLVVKQQAELLIVPAFTVVPKGYRAYAKYQWLSLAITRSREFVIPIVIADHLTNGIEYDVGAVSCIIDPSIKNARIKNIEDFVILPKGELATYTIDFNPIYNYRKYRSRNGLLQK
ncbi:MAG: hypothetical protein GPJ54_06335 [Candidatus Heimdallarchaeota archaeon]|nr:hypothetical protein [Candidatus Heimdallarchaeota archaeon]